MCRIRRCLKGFHGTSHWPLVPFGGSYRTLVTVTPVGMVQLTHPVVEWPEGRRLELTSSPICQPLASNLEECVTGFLKEPDRTRSYGSHHGTRR